MKSLLIIILLLSAAFGQAEEAGREEPPAFIREIVAIEIPKIAADDATLFELVDFVAHRITELDPRKPGGISFLTTGFNDRDDEEGELPNPAASEKKVDYSGADVRVDKVLTDLARLFEVQFHVTSVGVVVTPRGGKPFPNPKGDDGETYYTYGTKTGEQDGAGQAPTAPESK